MKNFNKIIISYYDKKFEQFKEIEVVVKYFL